MLRSRIVPCLLVHRGGLVKTINFKDPKYVGDPINAVRIFNEKEVDELMVIDIDATVDGRGPNLEMISDLAEECRMPLCYGGGVQDARTAKQIISLGVEKVAMSSAAIEDPSIVTAIANEIGTQSVVGIIDVERGRLARYRVRTHNATRVVKGDPVHLAVTLERAGAGEIVANSIDRDGAGEGYDIELALRLRERLDVPLTMLGGASSYADLHELVEKIGPVGAAAGSLFVFKGKYRAVLISYPTGEDKSMILAGQETHNV